MTVGLCDNLLLSTFRAWGLVKPILVLLLCCLLSQVAPCMNTEMYNHPLTSQQLATLKSWGVQVIEPVEKVLACGDVGKGGLPPVNEVVQRIKDILLVN